MSDLPEFVNSQLLETALTHRSALNERRPEALESNERLEYLGDAVLELVTTEFLYHKLPDTAEGKLTAIRSALVKTTTLSAVGQDLQLGEKLYLSRGEEMSGGRDNLTLIADTVEAIIGAIYLDQGLEMAKKFIQEQILVRFEEVMEKKLYKDAKSTLQEEVQSQGFLAPIYQVEEEDGPDHEKIFTVAVYVGGIKVGTGSGKSKQAAQQEAAESALTRGEYSKLTPPSVSGAADEKK